MSDLTVANTIKFQINTLDPMAFFAWGTKDLVGYPASDTDLGALGFSVRNCPNIKGVGHVKITLNFDDTYTVKVYKLKNYTKKLREAVLNGEEVDLETIIDQGSYVYADQLVKLIDGIVG